MRATARYMARGGAQRVTRVMLRRALLPLLARYARSFFRTFLPPPLPSSSDLSPLPSFLPSFFFLLLQEVGGRK